VKFGGKTIKENKSQIIQAFLMTNNDSAPKALCRQTVQDSIPIYCIHEQFNLIETYKGFFTRSYLIGENNYQDETEDVEQVITDKYVELLNSISTNCELAVTIFNKNIDMDAFKEAALKKEVGDELDYLRRELNEITINQMQEGSNGLVKLKIVTLGLHVDDVKRAAETFDSQLDSQLSSGFTKMSSSCIPMTLDQRLSIIHDIYNIDSQGTANAGFDINSLRVTGCDIKDVIGPSSFQFFKGYFRMGRKFCRVLQTTNLPTQLGDDFFVGCTNQQFNIMTTYNIKPVPPRAATKMVHKNLSLARNAKAEARKNLMANNLPEDMIPPEIEDRVDHAENIRLMMVEDNQKYFNCIQTVLIWADSLDLLNRYTEIVEKYCNGKTVGIRTMVRQQEEGLNTTLPLCAVMVKHEAKRNLMSKEIAGLSIPFDHIQLKDYDGINYSQHQKTKSLVLYNRLKNASYNGFILGMPGFGKSFTAKLEIMSVMLGSNADCIVIDPEGEYSALAKLIGGEIIKIAPGGKNHINPLEIFVDYDWIHADSEDDEGRDIIDPISAKTEFVMRLMEVIMNKFLGIDSVETALIDIGVRKLYEPFMIDEKLHPIPEDQMPTLADLFEFFMNRQEPQAYELAMALEPYVYKGSLNTFGFRSNVDTRNRFIVYDIKDVSEKMLPLAMLIILDSIQNRLFKNRKRGIHTWFWIDEIYLLFKQEMSANALSQMYKRARKYGGVPTGLTQNITDLLGSETARKMLANSTFVTIFNVNEDERLMLKSLLHLSDSQCEVITSAPKGQGLLYTGTNCIPIYSSFPKNNSIYRCITSNMQEIRAYEAMERKKKFMEKQRREEIDSHI